MNSKGACNGDKSYIRMDNKKTDKNRKTTAFIDVSSW